MPATQRLNEMIFRLVTKQVRKISLRFVEQLVIPRGTFWLELNPVFLPSPQALDTGVVRSNTSSSRQP